MKFEISAVLKYGLYAAAILLSTELLCSWYVRQRNRISHRPVHEVYFMMSNQKYCCSYSNTKKYTKCPNSYCKAKLSHKLIEHINSAKHIICIAIYMFTNKHFGDAILNAKKRGVTIRVISDESMIASAGTQINRLQLEGIPVRIAGTKDNYMHNKFCLIDVLANEKTTTENTHPHKGILINGSMNWTTNGLERNFENIIFTSDDHLKTEFKRAFDQMWLSLA